MANTPSSLTGQFHILPLLLQSCHGRPILNRVWTALWRGVHSREFMFKSLQESRQGKENAHDVYCSECGALTDRRSRNNAEGGAPNIFVAGVSLVNMLDCQDVELTPT